MWETAISYGGGGCHQIERGIWQSSPPSLLWCCAEAGQIYERLSCPHVSLKLGTFFAVFDRGGCVDVNLSRKGEKVCMKFH